MKCSVQIHGLGPHQHEKGIHVHRYIMVSSPSCWSCILWPQNPKDLTAWKTCAGTGELPWSWRTTEHRRKKEKHGHLYAENTTLGNALLRHICQGKLRQKGTSRKWKRWSILLWIELGHPISYGPCAPCMWLIYLTTSHNQDWTGGHPSRYAMDIPQIYHPYYCSALPEGILPRCRNPILQLTRKTGRLSELLKMLGMLWSSGYGQRIRRN